MKSPHRHIFSGNFDFGVVPDDPALIFHGNFGDSQHLSLTAADAQAVESAVLGSGLYHTDLVEMVHLLSCLKSKDGLLSKQVVRSFIATLNESSLSNEEAVEHVVSLVFGQSSEASVLPFPAVAAGLSMLCAGTKSTKLSLSFLLFDGDADGRLREDEMIAFLAAFLHVLVYASSEKRLDGSNLEWIGMACSEAADPMFRQRASIDFTQFSDYYNMGGFKSLGWIELLDLSKWTSLPKVVDVTSPMEDNLVSLSHNINHSGPAFALSVRYGEAHEIVRTVSREAALKVAHAVANAGLMEVTVEEIYSALTSYADDGLISKDLYLHSILQLLPKGKKLATSELTSYLEIVFQAMDVTAEGLADVTTLTCALSVLCGGGKSEKLSVCFQICDESTRQLLSRRALFHMLRAFFWTIWSLGLCDEETDNNSELESIFMDATILGICDDLLKCRTGTNGISFEDLASWYSETGFRLAPWLELLDLRKWKFLAESL